MFVGASGDKISFGYALLYVYIICYAKRHISASCSNDLQPFSFCQCGKQDRLCLQRVQESRRIISERSRVFESKLLTCQKWAAMDFHITW